MSLVKGKNVSMSAVTVSAAKSLDNGAKLVYVNYNKGRFNIQTPPMELAWDVNCYDEGPYPKYSCEVSFKGMDEDTKQGRELKGFHPKYSCEISFKGMDEDTKQGRELKGFHDKMVELEDKLIDEGVKNGSSWFKLAKGKVNKDVISSKFGPLVRVSKNKEGEPDGKWPSTMRLKLQYKDDKFGCKLYDTEGDQFLINNPESTHKIDSILLKGSKVKCVIQCVGLWIASGNYMCQWQLVKAEVEIPEGMVGDDFLPDTDDEDDDSGDVEEVDPKMLEDSEDEEVETPAPAPVPEVVEEPEEPEKEEPKSKPKVIKLLLLFQK